LCSLLSSNFGAVNSDQHQDKHEYNQNNYRNKEMVHIFILYIKFN